MRFVACVIWQVVHANPWNVAGSGDPMVSACMDRLRVHLDSWYQSNGVDVSLRIGRLTTGMLGDSTAPELRTKAAETGVLLPWALVLLRENAQAVRGAETWLAAGVALEEYMWMIDRFPLKMTAQQCEVLLAACLRHLHAYAAAGGFLTPKRRPLCAHDLAGAAQGEPEMSLNVFSMSR